MAGTTKTITVAGGTIATNALTKSEHDGFVSAGMRSINIRNPSTTETIIVGSFSTLRASNYARFIPPGGWIEFALGSGPLYLLKLSEAAGDVSVMAEITTGG